jgi:hypothetical protein
LGLIPYDPTNIVLLQATFAHCILLRSVSAIQARPETPRSPKNTPLPRFRRLQLVGG